MKKQITKGVLAAAIVAMSATPVMAQEFSGGKTKVDISVTKQSTEGDASYDVTVPTILAMTVDTSQEKPSVLIGSNGQGAVTDNAIGSLTFQNKSKVTTDGTTKDLGVALKQVKIESGEGSDWKATVEASILANPYFMSFKFGDDGEIMAFPDGEYYTASIDDFILAGADATKDLKVRADASGDSSQYQGETSAAAFYMEYWFTTVTNQEQAAN